MRTLKMTAVALAAALGPWIAAPAQAGYDITTLAGYEVVTTSTLNFSDTGKAGWSVDNGKVILGAKIISAGDSVSDFSVFRPTQPLETWNGYKLGANEYGWAFQDVANSENNPGVQIELYYAFKPDGYTITKSSTLNYSGTGYGGWSAPAGDVVSGGGYQFENGGASAMLSALGEKKSEWPHYKFGKVDPNEEGWVVQSKQVGGKANVYVISFDTPVPVPVPAALPIIGAALAGFGFAGWRQRKSAA